MRHVYLDNDFLEITRPIVGVDPTDGLRKLYHSNDVEAFFSAASRDDTPIGTLTVPCPEIGTSGRYPIVFDTSLINTNLGGLDEDTVVYRVLKGPGDLRVEDPFLVKYARPSDEI